MQVPDNASIYSNGSVVQFANGTEISFPFFSCLRAVHPYDYGIVLSIAANPKFIAAENGSVYTYAGGPGGDTQYFSVNGTATCTTTSYDNGSPEIYGCFRTTGVLFTLYSKTETVSGCGLTEPKELGEIQVNLPISPTGGLNVSNLTVEKEPIDSLNLFLCTTSTTFVPPSTSSS
ncbi:MAG: hypothetical protein ABSG45_06175 [Nitrososphaerales archaeon]